MKRFSKINFSKSSFSKKNRKVSAPVGETDIVIHFLEILNTIKLFHWKTTGYAVHKATDDLHAKLSGNIDSFVEIMLGKHGGRLNLQSQNTLTIKDYASTAHDSFKQEMERYKLLLQGLTGTLDASKDSDLLNIRDEMLGHVNQFLYLLTLH
jgi:DNA-binding ferritin-like protein